MAEVKKENIGNKNTMSLIESFRQFMAKVDWSELTIGEKEALYQSTYGVPNGEGIPFKVIPDNKEETIRIIYGDDETQLELRKVDLKKFRKWLEDTYMEKEVGEVWLSMERERERDEERNLRNTRYIYETNKSVLSALKMFFSLYNIGKDVTISKNGLSQKADYVVYDNRWNYRIVICVKPYDFISIVSFKNVFNHIIDAYPDAYFILTDGQQAVVAKASENPIMHTSFVISLSRLHSQFVSQPPQPLQDKEAKQLLTSAINNVRISKDNKTKKEQLLAFVDTLTEKDFVFTNSEICYLNEKKESQFFQLLVGTYWGSIVRFSSARRLYALLENGKMDMCSLVCMNDPSEQNYADRYIGLPEVMVASRDSFIISACAAERENDLTLWRLYGDDAKGICIKFDLWSESDLEKHGFYLGRVSYGSTKSAHYELEIISTIYAAFGEKGWKFIFQNWDIWKHFFKTHSYAIEDEIRLIYIPEKRLATKWHIDPIPESKWFKDDRTGIYSEMKLFDLTTNSGFPLRLSKIILGTKFPYPDENVKQFTARLKETKILTTEKKENVFVRSEIEDYR